MKKFVSYLTMVSLVFSLVATLNVTSYAATTWTCDTVSEIHTAFKNCSSGDKILIKSGTYTGSTSSSGNSNGYFYLGTDNVTVAAYDTSNEPLLKGTSTSSSYVLYVNANNCTIRNIDFSTGKKGIMLDESDNNLIKSCEVYNIGEEGIHLRDGSSSNTIQYCKVYDTGVIEPKYGEGIYVGSDVGKWGTYVKECDDNQILDNTIGPDVAAESIDIKEGTTGTIMANNKFYGRGISGANYADSFIDVKGDDCELYSNTFYQQDNSIIVDAIQIHERASGWGFNNDVHDNTFDLDDSDVYCVNAVSGSVRVSSNTRTSSGNMYTGNYTTY